MKTCGALMARLREQLDAPPAVEKNDPEEPSDHALGRSCGGFSTKYCILCDGEGHPLHFHLMPEQADESTAFLELLEGADAELADCDGTPFA